MKRISLLVFAVSALWLSSCTQESVESTTSSARAINQIGFLSNTTRANTLTISTLQGDEDGFAVYGVYNNDSAWHTDMDGENNYTYASGDWAWKGNTPEWPTDDASANSINSYYPINFYAYYTTEELGDDSGITLTDNGITDLALSYEAPTDGQTDILVATATANARPTGDRLPLVFNHILSKAKFALSIGEKMTMHTQSLGFNNICSNRTYSITGSDWEDQGTDIDNYPYLETTNTALILTSSNSSFDSSYGDLMLLPQTTTSWDTDDDSDEVTGCHIYMLYRAEYDGDVNAIGYEDASDHPNYDSTNSEMSKYDGEPLFVKVGYPLGDTDFVLKTGYSYSYNINMGTTDATNGYLLDDVYYDADGNPTEFEIEGKVVGDPISNGYINFTVSVKEWVESSTTLE